MKIFTILATVATLALGATAVSAGPFDAKDNPAAFNALDTATFATVLAVNSSEAFALRFDNDVASVQARIKNNPYLARTVMNQGYTIDQVVGIDGSTSNLTIYAL